MTTLPQGDTAVAVREEVQAKLPKRFKVLLHNDDQTTVDFVVHLLQTVFHKSIEQAHDITLQVHVGGHGVAGIFTKEIAQEKTVEATKLSQLNGFPLKITFEDE